MAPFDAHFSGALALDQPLNRRDRPKESDDGLLLVQVQLREPPEGVSAQRKSPPERLAIYGQVSQPLDPGVLRGHRPRLQVRVQIITQPHPACGCAATE